jgi:hypothetical protein
MAYTCLAAAEAGGSISVRLSRGPSSAHGGSLQQVLSLLAAIFAASCCKQQWECGCLLEPVNLLMPPLCTSSMYSQQNQEPPALPLLIQGWAMVLSACCSQDVKECAAIDPGSSAQRTALGVHFLVAARECAATASVDLQRAVATDAANVDCSTWGVTGAGAAQTAACGRKPAGYCTVRWSRASSPVAAFNISTARPSSTGCQ